MTPEQIEVAEWGGGALLIALGGPPAIRAAGTWLAGYIERRAKARTELEKAKLAAEVSAGARDDQREERTEARLWERLDAIEARSEAREKALAEAHALYLQTVQLLGEVKIELAKCHHDRADAAERIATLERANADLTGKIQTVAGQAARVEVKAELRRRESVTNMPAVREQKEPDK
jgi:chromosome segregation ATPase